MRKGLLKKFEYVPPKNGYPEWNNNPEIFQLNRLEPHAKTMPYTNFDDAVKGKIHLSDYYLSLNGEWKFHFSKRLKSGSRISIKPILIMETGIQFRYRVTGSFKDTIILNIPINVIRGRIRNILDRRMHRRSTTRLVSMSAHLRFRKIGRISRFISVSRV